MAGDTLNDAITVIIASSAAINFSFLNCYFSFRGGRSGEDRYYNTVTLVLKNHTHSLAVSSKSRNLGDLKEYLWSVIP